MGISDDILERMAERLWHASIGPEGPGWAELSTETREGWRDCARSAVDEFLKAADLLHDGSRRAE